MSKWTDIRDSVVDALNVDVVTEDMKNELTKNIVTNAIPAVEAVADKFTTQIQEQSKSETGSETVLSYRWSLMELSGQ